MAMAAVLMGGCADKKQQVEVWQPKPLVQWADIATQPVPLPSDDYAILDSEPTHGLFPAAMSISRIAVEENPGEYPDATPYLLRDPRNEVLQWNSAFDDQMAISEVFPIAKRDLGGARAHPEQVLAAMHALGAQVGLIYGMNELSETETEMIGTLYETATAMPIASFHAHAESVPPPEDRKERKAQDPWESDSKALVRARFEELVHDCVRRLIGRDLPAEVKAPEGWIPAGPIRPVLWPPRPYTHR